MKNVNGSEEFKTEVLDNKETVTVVDFYADWCGPCKALAPTLEELQAKFGDKLRIVKVNVDENRELAVEYGVRGIPSLQFFKNGEIKNTLNGNQPLSELESAVQNIL